jgi:hypothetical protein
VIALHWGQGTSASGVDSIIKNQFPLHIIFLRTKIAL